MINLVQFNALSMPVQSHGEWLMMFEFLQTHFADWGIEHPVIVEIGVQDNLQKAFYEKFLGAKHIGVDIETTYSTPDILGDAFSPQTVERAIQMGDGAGFDMIFIDANMSRDAARKFYDLWAPKTRRVIAIHTIYCTLNHPQGGKMLWDDLFVREREMFDFVTFYSYLPAIHPCHKYQMGTGLMIRR